MEHESPRPTRLECTPPVPAAPPEESVPDMLFSEEVPRDPDEVPCSAVPGRIASLAARVPVAPSPIDEDQAWRPMITASSGCRLPPVRPKSARSARTPRTEPAGSTDGHVTARDSTTTRAKPVRIKQGSWGNTVKKPNTPQRGSKKKVQDGLDDNLSTVQLRSQLPLKETRGSVEQNPGMAKKKQPPPAPKARESRSRNSSNGSTCSEFEFDQDYDGTGFQHVVQHPVTKKTNPEKCIIA